MRHRATSRSRVACREHPTQRRSTELSPVPRPRGIGGGRLQQSHITRPLVRWQLHCLPGRPSEASRCCVWSTLVRRRGHVAVRREITFTLVSVAERATASRRSSSSAIVREPSAMRNASVVVHRQRRCEPHLNARLLFGFRLPTAYVQPDPPAPGLSHDRPQGATAGDTRRPVHA